MNVREKIFLAFIIINVLLSLAYLLISLIITKRQRKRALFLFFFCLLVPGVGLIILFLAFLGYKFVFIKDVDLSDVIFSKERSQERSMANEEMDRNVVPLEEAIEITDKSELRKLVMNIAQGDYEESLAAISLALNCEDTETAHYAASVLQDALNNFRYKVSKEYGEIKARKDDYLKKATDLITYMNKFLIQHVFKDVEQKAFVEIMEDVASIIYEDSKAGITPDICETVSLRLLEVADFENCEKWCMRSKSLFPNELSSYTCALKYYFNSDNKEKFFAELKELKASDIIIDKETLELIRAFQ